MTKSAAGTAVLGWGSLLWSPREPPVDRTGRSSGPVLPIEFSRIARDARLTLVVDREQGAPVRTGWSHLEVRDLGHAIDALASREMCESAHIGWVDLLEGSSSLDRHPSQVDVRGAVTPWAQQVCPSHE